MNEEISLIELFDALKRNKWTIFLFSLLGLVVAAVYSFILATPVYESTTQLLVNRTSQENAIQQSEITANVQLISTYEDIIRNPIILEDVIDELGLDVTVPEMREVITVTTDSNSQVFSINAQASNADRAAAMANTTADVFQEKLPDIMNVNNITIISEAVPNSSPVSPRPVLNLVIGLLIGLGLGIIVALIVELTDTTIKDPELITENLGWSNLGSISLITEDDIVVTRVTQTKQYYNTDEDADDLPTRRRSRV